MKIEYCNWTERIKFLRTIFSFLTTKVSFYWRNQSSRTVNNNVKGRPNSTVGGFCEWVNTDLLINKTLELGYPKKIGLETARK